MYTCCSFADLLLSVVVWQLIFLMVVSSRHRITMDLKSAVATKSNITYQLPSGGFLPASSDHGTSPVNFAKKIIMANGYRGKGVFGRFQAKGDRVDFMVDILIKKLFEHHGRDCNELYGIGDRGIFT